MIKFYFILNLIFTLIVTTGCEQKSIENQFNPNLTKEFCADDYSMKKYTMVFLKCEPNKNLTDEATNLQQQHLDNIHHQMAEDTTLLLAGPFLDGGDVRSIYIFNIEPIEEV